MINIVSYILSTKWAKKYTDTVVQAFVHDMKYKGSVETPADLPTASSSNKGWLYTVLSNGHEYVSDGTQWVDLA